MINNYRYANNTKYSKQDFRNIVSSHDTKANISGLPSLPQFEDILSDIKNVLSSNDTLFCKTFAIADLVKPEIINNTNIPEIKLVC